MNPNTKISLFRVKEKEIKEIEAMTRDFLSRGGVIQHIPSNVSSDKKLPFIIDYSKYEDKDYVNDQY